MLQAAADESEEDDEYVQSSNSLFLKTEKRARRSGRRPPSQTKLSNPSFLNLVESLRDKVSLPKVPPDSRSVGLQLLSNQRPALSGVTGTSWTYRSLCAMRTISATIFS